jgi:DNA-binding MarR family transcriptional regulator
MKSPDLKPHRTGEGKRLEVAADQEGCLYSPAMREMLSGHAPAEAVPALEACAALGHAARLMHQRMERWADKEGLTEGRLGILFMLRHFGGAVPLGTLAANLHVSPRNVTGLVDNLERDGLVVRVPDPADRRSVQAQLTDRGWERINALGDVAVAEQRSLMAGFGDEELARFRHMCLRLAMKLESALQTGKA